MQQTAGYSGAEAPTIDYTFFEFGNSPAPTVLSGDYITTYAQGLDNLTAVWMANYAYREIECVLRVVIWYEV